MSGGKVGVVGYCLGGLLAFLTATRTDADAIVSYYGAGIDQQLHESHAIGKPLMMHLAKADKYIGHDARKAIHEAMGGHRNVTIHDYEGKDHAFARAIGPARKEEAANKEDGKNGRASCGERGGENRKKQMGGG